MRRVVSITITTAVVIALAACADNADMQAQSLAQWKAYCVARGKQFLWKDTAENHGMLMNSVQVEGRCVGPGERGYIAPEPPDSD